MLDAAKGTALLRAPPGLGLRHARAAAGPDPVFQNDGFIPEIAKDAPASERPRLPQPRKPQ